MLLFSPREPTEAQVLFEFQVTVAVVASAVPPASATRLFTVPVRVSRLFQLACATAGTPATSVAASVADFVPFTSSAPKLRPMLYSRAETTGLPPDAYSTAASNNLNPSGFKARNVLSL